jgi:hypothetical protein
MSSATWLLTRRALIQFPRNPMVLGFSVAPVLMTTVPGIANAAVGLAGDFQSRYLHKLLTLPVSIGAVMEQVPSPVLRAVIGLNPTEYVLRAMRDLTLVGFEWGSIVTAFAVIVALGVVGLPLTIRNYRSVYR